MAKNTATVAAVILELGGILWATASAANDATAVNTSSRSRATPTTQVTSSPAEGSGIELAERYSVHPDIVYSKANGVELKLDIYQPEGPSTRPYPTLVYMHGGGWLDIASKNSAALELIPFLERGWIVINVDYRPSSVSLAPAAVEDCLCALRWIGRNGSKYSADISRLVLMGHSAGGHLALTTGMAPLTTSGLGAPCSIEDMYGPTTDIRYPPPAVKVAAIVNWYGITNLADILEGTEQQGYAVKWLGNQPGRASIVEAVSPISYVRAGVPPIITIHGTSDRVVPYSQAKQLHSALSKAGVPNQLISVADQGHGRFGIETTKKVYAQVFEFLKVNGVMRDGE